MSTDPGASQPPSTEQTSEDSQATQPVASFASAFIQKGASARKFAPKAARRRPQTARTQSQTPQLPASQEQPPPPGEGPQDKPNEARTDTASEGQRGGETAGTVEAQAREANSSPQEHTVEENAPASAGSSAPRAATPTETQEQANAPQSPPAASTLTQPASTSASIPPLVISPNDSTLTASSTRSTISSQPKTAGPTPTDAVNVAQVSTQGTDTNGQNEGISAHTQANSTPEVAPIPQNTPPNETAPAETSTRARARPRAGARGKRKRDTPIDSVNNAGNETTENVADDGTEAPARKKAKRKKATGNTAQEDTQGGPEQAAGQGAAAKSRKPRASRKRKSTEGQEDGGAEGTQPRPKRKRAKKARTANAENANEENAEDNTEPKRRGRHRSPTPSDAEDCEIDPSTAIMWDLAAHDVRYGKISEREKQMREVNWEEVKEKRRLRERELAYAGRENEDPLAAAAGALNEQDNVAQTPGMRVNAQGEIVVDETTTYRDVYAEADREAQLLETVDENDFTMRVNTQSYVLSNKRDPADRIMTGRAKRWTSELTNQFYDALGMFGTDFMMISTLFPSMSRYSIKNKFNREEKDNPDRVKAALSGIRTANWDQYLQMANVKDEDFVDPDELKAALEQEEKALQVLVDQAAAERAEERRQKRLAGISDSEDDGDAGKEKGKKKRKQREKNKPFEFPQEEGVEIVEEFDE